MEADQNSPVLSFTINWAIYRNLFKEKVILYIKLFLYKIAIENNYKDKIVLKDYIITVQITNISVNKKCIIEELLVKNSKNKIKLISKNNIVIKNNTNTEQSCPDDGTLIILNPGDKISFNIVRGVKEYDIEYNYIEQIYKNILPNIGCFDSYLKQHWCRKAQFKAFRTDICNHFKHIDNNYKMVFHNLQFEKNNF